VSTKKIVCIAVDCPSGHLRRLENCKECRYNQGVHFDRSNPKKLKVTKTSGISGIVCRA